MKLEWKDNRADVSKWFGEGAAYTIRFNKVSGFGWGYGQRNRIQAINTKPSSYPSEAEAKQAAQEHFNARLKEPMDFGAAMAAVARGCCARWEEWEDGQYVCDDGCTTVVVYSDGDEYNPTKGHIKGKWYFHIEPEPEKVYAKVAPREAWKCGKCGKVSFLDWENASAECLNCGVTMHRPEGE